MDHLVDHIVHNFFCCGRIPFRTWAACVVGSTFSSANNAAPCHDVGTCSTGEHVSQAPTASSDVVCSTTGNCTANQYESKPPTSTSDRNCTANQYESKPPTSTS